MQLDNKKIGLYLGPLFFLLVLVLPTPTDMSFSAQVVGATAVLMAIWWISEALPFAATALLPVCLFPLFSVMDVDQVTSNYAHQIIFLFLSGFIFALCIERWHLHKRIALHTIKMFGFSYKRILLGFMLATAFLSMWVSNTATTLMMIPIATAVVAELGRQDDIQRHAFFGLSLLLGIAYSASIGGVATLIGTPPNAILAGMLEQQTGLSLNFLDWMLFALPLASVFLIITYFYLARSISTSTSSNLNLDKTTNLFQQELSKLKSLSKEEKLVITVFSTVCCLWITRGFIDIEIFNVIKDSTIGMLGAILLFVLPARNGKQRLMDWETTKKLPWEILILFGGGFALASGFEHTELTQWLALKFSFIQGANYIIIIFVIVLFVIFLTEITSNTATATLLIPLMIALSQTLDISPLLLATAVAIATSYAFMLPVATPPNAIVFSSGLVPIQKMAKTGFWLNIIGSILITVSITFMLPLVW